MSREWFEIAPDHRERLAALGLASFQNLMKAETGTLLSREDGGREVWRLDDPSDGGCYFLKRRGAESLLPQLELLMRTGRFHSGPVREALMVRLLRDAGFAAMEPVAWGELRHRGIPQGGFFVSRGISGSSLADIFEASRGVERLRVMHKVGLLVGRLHARGFLHPVRLKDLIVRPDGELVLIDRETSKPWPKRYSRTNALAVLARAARRTLRDGHRPGAGSTVRFLRGYHAGVAEIQAPQFTALRRDFMRQLRRELS